jgi:hypothetical protein
LIAADLRGACMESIVMLGGTYTSTGFAGPHDAAAPAAVAVNAIDLRTRNAGLTTCAVDGNP